MMRLLSAFLLIALSAIAAVKATNTAGDPTDLANWPPCSQKCVPIGLQAPTSCNSLSNRTCICQDPAFTLAIGDCEVTSCSAEEATQIQDLTTPLCSPVGGLAANVVSAVSSFQAMSSPVAVASSGLASYPATTTPLAASVASGDPTKSASYPLCAQKCQNASIPTTGCGSLANRACLCSNATSSAMVGGCEIATCSAPDLQITLDLANSLCAPVGGFPNAFNASATTATAAPVASRDPTKSTSYPLCAQKCQNASIPASGCGSLANRTCICTSDSLNAAAGSCEVATCSASDGQITRDLVDSLCNGFANAPNASNRTTATPSPSPIAFAGNAIVVVTPWLGWIVIGLSGLAGWQAVL